VRGDVRRREIPAGRVEKLLLRRGGIGEAQFAQVLLEICALQGQRRITLDEEDPQPVRQ